MAVIKQWLSGSEGDKKKQQIGVGTGWSHTTSPTDVNEAFG